MSNSYFDQHLGAGENIFFYVFQMLLQDFDAKAPKNDIKMSISVAYSQMLVDTKMLIWHPKKLVETLFLIQAIMKKKQKI